MADDAQYTDDTEQGLPECNDCNRLIQVPSDHETFCPSKGDLIE